MDTGYLARIDPAELRAHVDAMTRDGANRVQVNFDEDGRFVSAAAATSDQVPAGEIDVRIRRAEPLPY